jgi:hypothetical protein
MRRGEAEAERDRLRRDDRQHTYFVREQPVGKWEVVRTNIPRPTQRLVAEHGELADVPEDPRPFINRLIPPYGPAGFG